MFVNSEMILSVMQMVEIQCKAFQEFQKQFDTDEARKQTEIFMRAIFSPRPKNEQDKKET